MMTNRAIDIKYGRGLNLIRISGFKSIVNPIEIKIKPLTIIAGSNSSGKSSAMQMLLLLKQTLQAGYDAGAIKIDGPNIFFTNFNQFFSDVQSKDKRIVLDLFFDQGIGVQAAYKLQTTSRTISICDFKTIEPTEKGNSEFIFRSNGRNNRLLLKASRETYERAFQNSKVDVKIERNKCFYQIKVNIIRNSQSVVNEFPFPSPAVARASEIIEDLIHLPGLRGNPERHYAITANDTNKPGKFENYTAGIIWHWFKYDKRQFKRLVSNIVHLGLTGELKVRKREDYAIEIQVGRSKNSPELVNIADVGLGVSQVLPILVALLYAKPGQVIFVEQPEIHLHPLAQAKLADTIAVAVKRGVRVVIETHSSNLLLALQTLIAQEEIDFNHVSLNWFSKDEKGYTVATHADVDSSGSFGDWPSDFDSTLLGLQDAYITAVEEKLDYI